MYDSFLCYELPACGCFHFLAPQQMTNRCIDTHVFTHTHTHTHTHKYTYTYTHTYIYTHTQSRYLSLSLSLSLSHVCTSHAAGVFSASRFLAAAGRMPSQHTHTHTHTHTHACMHITCCGRLLCLPEALSGGSSNDGIPIADPPR
jgi:hypothetical protein